MPSVTQLARDIAAKTRLVIAARSRQAGQWLTAPRDPITWEALRAKLAARPLPSTYAGRLAALGIVLLLLLPLWLWYAEERRDQKTGVATYPNASLINPILGGLGALVLIYAAIRQARTASAQADIARKQAEIASDRYKTQTTADQQRRITENYTKAVEQLSSDKIEQRLGGIYTLERISKESPDDYWTIMETLTAFVRERARWKEPDADASETMLRFYEHKPDSSIVYPGTEPPTDIAAVLTVIGKERERPEGGRPLDLRACESFAAGPGFGSK